MLRSQFWATLMTGAVLVSATGCAAIYATKSGGASRTDVVVIGPPLAPYVASLTVALSDAATSQTTRLQYGVSAQGDAPVREVRLLVKELPR